MQSDRRFLSKRVSNLLGESDLDDAVVKQLLNEVEQHLEVLLTQEDQDRLYYEQGYIAALRSCVEKVRYNNKKRLVQSEDEDND
jgi:hypothetical protein